MTSADLIAIGIFWIGLCPAAAWFFCRQARWARRMEAELTDTTGGKQGHPDVPADETAARASGHNDRAA